MCFPHVSYMLTLSYSTMNVKYHLLKTVMLIQFWELDVVIVRVFASSIKYYVFNIRFGLCKDCKIGIYKLVLTILYLLHAVFQERLRTQLYDIVNFTYIWSNIPAASAYGVCISQLIRYFRACGSYRHFLDGELLLTRKLLNQRISWPTWLG